MNLLTLNVGQSLQWSSKGYKVCDGEVIVIAELTNLKGDKYILTSWLEEFP